MNPRFPKVQAIIDAAAAAHKHATTCTDQTQPSPVRSPAGAAGDAVVGPVDPTTVRLAQLYLRARETRSDVLPQAYLSDPAWDIMLELYVALGEGRRLAACDVGHTSGVALSTGLRWVNKLVADGFLQRGDDPFDRRRTFVWLAPESVRALEDWIANKLARLWA